MLKSPVIRSIRKAESHLMGLPKATWGVTNNIRPSLRAPRYEEAAVDVAADAQVSQTVRVAR